MSGPTSPPPGWHQNQPPLPNAQPTGPAQVVYVQRPSQAVGVVALVAGLIGIAVAMGPAIFGVFALAAGATAFVCGIVATVKGNGRGMGIAGLVLGAIACMIAFAMLAQVQSAVDNLDRAFPGSDRNVRDTFGPSGQS